MDLNTVQFVSTTILDTSCRLDLICGGETLHLESVAGRAPITVWSSAVNEVLESSGKSVKLLDQDLDESSEDEWNEEGSTRSRDSGVVHKQCFQITSALGLEGYLLKKNDG